MDTVTVGRIVHYVQHGFETGRRVLAAMVIHVHDDGRVNLTVFHWGRQEYVQAVPFDAEGRDGTWRWPERV